MNAKTAFGCLTLAIGLAGCAPTSPCPCSPCEEIGWFTGHSVGICAPIAAVPPPPPPPPPPPTQRRGG